MQRTSSRLVIARAVAALTILLAAGRLADAQPPPTSASSADAALAAQKAAFLALPESTRKTAQDALVWLGFYNGVVDGDFGRGTRNAILAYQASVKAPQDGALSAPEIKALLASAQKARDAVGFQIVKDAKTGASDRRANQAHRRPRRSEARLGREPGRRSRRPLRAPRRRDAGPQDCLQGDQARRLFRRLGAGRSVELLHTIRQERGGESADPRLHLRLSLVPGGSARSGRDRGRQFVRAVSAARNDAGRQRGDQRRRRACDRAAAPPAPNPAPAATALVVAPGRALTALKADDCPNPTVDGKPVRVERTDAATNLAMIAGDFGPKGEPPRFGAPGPDVVVLGFAGPRLAASPASLSGGEARPAIVAAVEASGGGGPVFDRRGALVGLVAPIEGVPKRVAGVALAAPHAVIAPDAIRAFLGASESGARRRGRPQRRRHRRAREGGARRRLLPEVARPARPYPSMSHFSALAPASSRTRFSSAPNVRASPS